MLNFFMQLRLFLTRDQLQEAIGDVDHVLSFVRGKIKLFFKRLAYGSAIGVVSLVVIGGSMYAFGLTPFPEAAEATVAGTIAGLFAQVILAPIYVLFGVLLAIFAAILDMVVAYPWGADWNPLVSTGTTQGGFVNVSAVVTGWRIVRDICNLFFAIILLVIAMAAVLNLESYKWQDLLRKFVLYAVLINFSKTICGFFTDAATVAMATFGGSLGTSWGAGILGSFGLPAIGGLTEVTGLQNQVSAQGDGVLEMLGAIILMVIFQVLALAILAAFVVMIVLRIIMLWFLIVLSPIAYVTRILDITKRYSSQWWEMWGRYLIMGPFIVFFLWLTLTMMNGSATGVNADGIGGAAATPLVQGLSEVDQIKSLQSTTATGGSALSDLQGISSFQATQPNIIANFAIAFVMLFGALRFSSGMAGEVGSYVSSASDLVGSASGRLVGTASRWASDRAGEVKSGKIPNLLGGAVGGVAGYINPSWKDALNTQLDTSQGIGRGVSNFGYGLDILANTVLDPKGAFTNLRNNFDKATKRKEDASSAASQAMAKELADPTSSKTSRFIGGLFGAFTDEGQAYVKDATVGGAARYVKGLFTGEQARAEKKDDDEIAKKKAEEARRKAILDAEIARQAGLTDADIQALGPVSVKALENAVGSNDQAFELDMQDLVVRGAVDAQVRDLRQMASDLTKSDPAQANILTKSADYLQDMLDTGANVDLATLDADMQGIGLEDSLRTALPGAITQAAREIGKKTVMEKLKSDVDKLKGDLGAATDDRKSYQNFAFAKRGVVSYEAQASFDRMIAEDAKSIDSLSMPELEPEYYRAVLSGNKNRALAIINKGSASGDFPMILRGWTQKLIDSDDGFRDKMMGVATAAPDISAALIPTEGRDKGKLLLNERTEGQLAFMRGVLMDSLGMSEQEAMRKMFQISGAEIARSRKAFIGTIMTGPEGFEANMDPESRKGLQNLLTQAKSLVEFRSRDFMNFGTRNGRFEFDRLLDSGQEELIRFGEAMTDSKEFKAWHQDAKNMLSRPEVRAQLTDKKNNPYASRHNQKLLEMLTEEWNRNNPNAQTNIDGSPITAGGKTGSTPSAKPKPAPRGPSGPSGPTGSPGAPGGGGSGGSTAGAPAPGATATAGPGTSGTGKKGRGKSGGGAGTTASRTRASRTPRGSSGGSSAAPTAPSSGASTSSGSTAAPASGSSVATSSAGPTPASSDSGENSGNQRKTARQAATAAAKAAGAGAVAARRIGNAAAQTAGESSDAVGEAVGEAASQDDDV